MITPSYCKEQARIRMREAAAVASAVSALRLRQCAQQYLVLAAALEPPARPQRRSTAAAQQQQQYQQEIARQQAQGRREHW